jgi:Haem-binding domain
MIFLVRKRRAIKRVGLAAAAGLLASQLVPVNRSNPTVDPSKTLDAAQSVPAAVQSVFDRSCKNCHSDETKWPWYSYVAPVSWVIAHDVHEGRNAMNFSRWGNYTASKKEDRLEEICEQVTNGDMPDRKYAFVWRNARVTAVERAAICQWADDAREY